MLSSKKFNILDKENFKTKFKEKHPKMNDSQLEDTWKKVSKGYDFVLYFYDEKNRINNYYSVQYIQNQMRKEKEYE